MDAIEFIAKYANYLSEVKGVTKQELYPIIDEMEKIDPHDLVSPDTFFSSETQARGYVWSIFVQKAKKHTAIN